MKNKKICNDTFCAAPWFMARNSNLNEYQICCIWKKSLSEFKGKIKYDAHKDNLEDWTNSNYLKYVRKHLASGKKIKECSACWEKEKNNQRSLRNVYNQEFFSTSNLENSWLSNYFKNHSFEDYGFVVGADLKLNNVCNFACAMCNPEDSSIIATDWKKSTDDPFVQKELSKDPSYLNTINAVYKQDSSHQLLHHILQQPRLKILKILGGEPLLNKKMLNMLNHAERKDQIRLMFVTNGSIDIEQIAIQLKDYKFLYFVVSVDGHSDYNNYIRKNSNWEQICKNILNAKKLQNVKISVHPTIQALSFPSIARLLQWCLDNNIEWSYDLCNDPEYLSINALPREYFETELESVRNIDCDLANYIQSQYNDLSDLYKNDLIQFLNWYNKKNYNEFKKLYANLYKFLTR